VLALLALAVSGLVVAAEPSPRPHEPLTVTSTASANPCAKAPPACRLAARDAILTWKTRALKAAVFWVVLFLPIAVAVALVWTGHVKPLPTPPAPSLPTIDLRAARATLLARTVRKATREPSSFRVEQVFVRTSSVIPQPTEPPNPAGGL